MSNLREATRSQNIINRPKAKLKRTLPKWVYRNKNKSGKIYDAVVSINQKLIRLGSFDNVNDAFQCSSSYIKSHHKEFFNGGKCG